MIRRLFFWFLVLSFLIITPLLILYALGYRYSFDRGIFIFSGSITLKSNPEEVSFDINGKLVPLGKINYLNKSYHIDGLKPGEYSIRAHRDGFQDWKKTITVQSGISTEFWNVILPRSEYPILSYTGTDFITRFFPAPKDTLLAIVKQAPENPYSAKITIVNTENNTSEEIYSSDSERLTTDILQNIEWSPREDILIVPLEIAPTPSDKKLENITITETHEKYLLLPLDTKTPSRYLSEILPAGWSPSRARWSPDERETLYFMDKESLWKIVVPETGIVEPILVTENILGYDFYTSNIVVLKKENHIFYRYGLDINDEPRQITTISLSEENNDPHRIVVYDDRKIATLNSQRDLFIHNTYKDETITKKIASSIDGVQFSDDGKKLLFWNNHEMFVYYNEKWETQPQQSENTTIQVARFFDPISNVQWSKNYEHILFNQGSEMRILGLDTRGGQDSFVLKKTTTSSPNIFMSARDDKIYFTDNQDGSFHLFSIDFPEPTGFFGT